MELYKVKQRIGRDEKTFDVLKFGWCFVMLKRK